MRQLLTLAVVAIGLAPAPARADGFVVPFAGANSDTASANGSRATYGAALGVMGAGMLGLEIDAAFAPNFVAHAPTHDSSSVTTVMGNLIVGLPLGALRPYASGGVGLIRQSVERPSDLLNFTNQDFGTNLGGGLMAFFSRNVGLRADLRLFRDLNDRASNSGIDPAAFHFWRGTLGVAFKF